MRADHERARRLADIAGLMFSIAVVTGWAALMLVIPAIALGMLLR